VTPWRVMGDVDLVTAADVRLMQGLAQRVTAIRPDLVNSDATFGELAWIWGKGHGCDGGTWPCRLWFSGGALVAWGWAYLPHRVRRSDGSVTDVTGAYLGYQVHPGHAALVDDVIGWYEAVAAGIERTVVPRAADGFALKRWAAHGYQIDPTRPTRPPSSSRSGRIRTTGVCGSALRCSCTGCIWRGRPGPLT
jgi:hypothetical protein